MYERLTKRVKPDCLKTIPELYKEYAVTINNEIVAFEGCFDNKDIYEDYRMALDRLCEIEDKICEGRMLELPCSVGQTVYEVQPMRARTQAYEITTVKWNGHYWWFSWVVKDRNGIYGNVDGFSSHQIGKTVFLTPEEANKKLKELENEETDK